MPYQEGRKLMASLGVDTASSEKSYLSRNLSKRPTKWVDYQIYDLIIPRLQSRNPEVAKEVTAAKEDDRITNMFCDESQLYEQLHRFIDAKSFTHSKQSYRNYKAAWKLFREMVPKTRGYLKPILINELESIGELFSNPDASSGIIAYPKHKKNSLEEISRVAHGIVNGFVDDDGHVYHEYDTSFHIPAIALTRAQITDYVDEHGKLTPEDIRYKTRLVMCVDAASVAVESQFGIPLMNFFKKVKQYAGGQDDAVLSDFLLNNCRGKHWISIDYSKFDASIQWWLIKDIFDYLSEFFEPIYKPAFNWISNNFINMQILMPDGTITWLNKGIKSGSYFTQLVGSIANIIMQFTGLCEQFGELTTVSSDENQNLLTIVHNTRRQLVARNSNQSSCLTLVAMGDDSITFTYSPIDVERLSKYLKKMFKVTITLDGEKGFKSGLPYQSPVFLKRVWKTDGRHREPVEMWVHLIHPERKREYEKKGFSPYHVLYGYYLTFKGTMREYFSEEELVWGMHYSPGGLDAFAKMSINDLPGSLRFQILSRGVDRTQLVKELKMEYSIA